MDRSDQLKPIFAEDAISSVKPVIPVYLNSFSRWRLGKDFPPIPEGYRLFRGDYQYSYCSSAYAIGAKEAIAQDQCYVLAIDERDAKYIVEREMKLDNSEWFGSIDTNTKKKMLDSMKFQAVTRVDDGYEEFTPINDVNFTLSCDEFLHSYYLITELNGAFEKSEEK